MQHQHNAGIVRRSSDTRAASAGPHISDAAFYRAVSTAAHAGLVVQTMTGEVLWANQAYMDMMGLPIDEILGRVPLSYAVPPADTPSAAELANFRYTPSHDKEPQVSIHQNMRGNGELFWVEIHVSFDHLREYGEVAIAVARDISDHIKRQQDLSATSAKLAHLAATDNLTGLANRMNIMAEMEKALAVPPTKGSVVGLLEIDLDHFKAINDSFGHSAGDAILAKLADTLRDVIGPNDTAARVGGDEFLVLCPQAKSLEAIEQLGRQIIDQSRSKIQVNGAALNCNLSIGASISCQKQIAPEDLLKQADFALYEAKRNGRGRVASYDSNLHKRHVEQTQLADELCEAVDTKSLTFHFQPTMSLETGHIRAFETLVRWQNPRLGLISPVDFLPLGKSLALMAEIDFAALQAALDLKYDLNQHGHDRIRVGLNGSAELLGHPAFFDTLMSALNDRGLTPPDVVIEVLETVVFGDVSQSNPLVDIVQRLHDAGVMTLLDDFGTGHAGLSHLATLAVSGVKVDRSLTKNILTDPTCAKIIAMMFELCRDLDLYTVTEGIETTQQAQAIVQMGGTVMQGYWLAKAMPAEDVIGWLATRENITDQIARSPIAAVPSASY